MTRNPNTTVSGAKFGPATVDSVWNKATPIIGRPGFAKDTCGATIERSKYGQTVNYGWEIDHMVPVSQGGSDYLFNLQPLQWENNRHKGDNWPTWSCKNTN